MTEIIEKTVKLSWGTLLQGSLILATVLLSFSHVKMQANHNKDEIAEVKNDVKDNTDSINIIKTQNATVIQRQDEILRRLDENREYYEKANEDMKQSHRDIMEFIKNFEVVDD